jgi:hypothetical protein
MKWRQDLNEVEDLGNKVRFKVFAEAQNPIAFSLDNQNFMNPNTNKNGVQGFEITIDKVGGQNFWVREIGFLKNP